MLIFSVLILHCVFLSWRIFSLLNPLPKPYESHNVNYLFPENPGYTCLFHAV